jgi:hypothetical protein
LKRIVGFHSEDKLHLLIGKFAEVYLIVLGFVASNDCYRLEKSDLAIPHDAEAELNIGRGGNLAGKNQPGAESRFVRDGKWF